MKLLALADYTTDVLRRLCLNAPLGSQATISMAYTQTTW